MNIFVNLNKLALRQFYQFYRVFSCRNVRLLMRLIARGRTDYINFSCARRENVYIRFLGQLAPSATVVKTLKARGDDPSCAICREYEKFRFN